MLNKKVMIVSLGCDKNLVDTGENAWHSCR